MTKLSEIGGRRLPFLRWSAVRMMVGMRHLTTHWQVGDGREDALADYVELHAARLDPDDVVRVIDEFCYREKVMMNVGDEKGEILDAAVRRAQPRRLLELGAYCGYSAVRTARSMPAGATLCTIEFSEANADIARRILAHAGVADRVTVLVGSIGDGGRTIERLESEHGFAPETLDFVFIDHDKTAYLSDLERILERCWLRPGAVVVADNVRIPGAPAYRRYMKWHEGRMWRTIEHKTRVEYQAILPDLVLESDYLGPGQ
jgi:catechol O-methyltransferase